MDKGKQNPFDRYIELLAKLVVRYGEENRWSPIQINKTFLILMMEDLGIIPPFSIGRRPAVSVTQQLLYIDYSKNIILTDPHKITKPITLNSSSKSENLNKIEDGIDIIWHSLKDPRFNTPYLLKPDKLQGKIKKSVNPQNFLKARK